MPSQTIEEVKIAIVNASENDGDNEKDLDKVLSLFKENNAVVFSQRLGTFTSSDKSHANPMMRYMILVKPGKLTYNDVQFRLQDSLRRRSFDLWLQKDGNKLKKWNSDLYIELLEPVRPDLVDDDGSHPIIYNYRFFVTTWGFLTIDDIQSVLNRALSY